MMERRIIVVATVRKNWTPIRRKAKEVAKNVAVILGDPRKPDFLKPYSIFDDDDFLTIDKLKTALRELKDYHFSYLDNHNTLIEDLKRLELRIPAWTVEDGITKIRIRLSGN